MAQSVIPKDSPEAICLGGGLVVGGLLASIGIKDNRIISGIPNYIPSSSKIQYAVKKSHEATFIRIAAYVCNYTCSMSCSEEERAGIVHLVKYICFWDG